MLSTHVEIIESIGRLSVALALGSAIGFERQWRQKMAGLRTNALVALGSCGFVVFGAIVGEGDPTRIAAQVVTGIGFLGAGIILRRNPRGVSLTHHRGEDHETARTKSNQGVGPQACHLLTPLAFETEH